MADAPKTPLRQTLSRRAKRLPSVNEDEPPPEAASAAPMTPTAARKRATTKSESTPKSVAKAPKSVAAAKTPKRKPSELGPKDAVTEEAKESSTKTPRKRAIAAEAATKQSSDDVPEVAEAPVHPVKARIGGQTPRKRTAVVPAAALVETLPATTTKTPRKRATTAAVESLDPAPASAKKTPRKRATTAARSPSPEVAPPVTTKTPRKRATTAAVETLEAAPASTKKTPRKRATTAAVVVAETVEVALPKTPARTPRRRATVAPTADVAEVTLKAARTPRKRATMADGPVETITPADDEAVAVVVPEKQITPPRFPVKQQQNAIVAADNEDEELARPLPAGSAPSVGDVDIALPLDESEIVPETPSPVVVVAKALLSSTFDEGADVDQSSVYDLANAESMVVDERPDDAIVTSDVVDVADRQVVDIAAIGDAAEPIATECAAEKPAVDVVAIDVAVEGPVEAISVSDAVDGDSESLSEKMDDAEEQAISIGVSDASDQPVQCTTESPSEQSEQADGVNQPGESVGSSDAVECATVSPAVDVHADGDAAEPIIERKQPDETIVAIAVDAETAATAGNTASEICAPATVDSAAPIALTTADDDEFQLHVSSDESDAVEPQATATESKCVVETAASEVIESAPTVDASAAPNAETSDDVNFKLQVTDEEATEPVVFLEPESKPSPPTTTSTTTNEQCKADMSSIDLTGDTSFDSPATAVPHIILIPDTPSGFAARPLNETFSPEPSSPPRAVSTTRKAIIAAVPFGTPRAVAALKPLKGIRKRSFSVDVSQTMGTSKANKSVIFHSPSNQMLPIDAIDMQMEQSRREELMQTSSSSLAGGGGKENVLRAVGGRRKRSMSMCETGAVHKVGRPAAGTPRRLDASAGAEHTPKKTRIPDFRAIHQRNFDRMESIADYKERVTGASGGGPRARIAKPVNRAATAAVPASKTAEVKARTMAAIRADLVQPVTFKPKPKEAAVSSFSTSAWKPPTMSSIPTFGGTTSSRSATASSATSSSSTAAAGNISKLADRQAKNRALINKGHTAKAADVKERNTQILRGVRSNRRFELQMKFRNEHED